MLGINLTRKVQNIYKEKLRSKGPKVTLKAMENSIFGDRQYIGPQRVIH